MKKFFFSLIGLGLFLAAVPAASAFSFGVGASNSFRVNFQVPLPPLPVFQAPVVVVSRPVYVSPYYPVYTQAAYYWQPPVRREYSWSEYSRQSVYREFGW